MRNLGGTILFSATDLMRFIGCAHATTLDLMHLRGEGPEPGEDTEDAVLLQKQGDAHEAAHLEKLKTAGKAVLEIPRGDLVADARATREALAQGAEVIFQGAFLSGAWGGWSDFLMRVDPTPAPGPGQRLSWLECKGKPATVRDIAPQSMRCRRHVKCLQMPDCCLDENFCVAIAVRPFLTHRCHTVE